MTQAQDVSQVVANTATLEDSNNMPAKVESQQNVESTQKDSGASQISAQGDALYLDKGNVANSASSSKATTSSLSSPAPASSSAPSMSSPSASTISELELPSIAVGTIEVGEHQIEMISLAQLKANKLAQAKAKKAEKARLAREAKAKAETQQTEQDGSPKKTRRPRRKKVKDEQTATVSSDGSTLESSHKDTKVSNTSNATKALKDSNASNTSQETSALEAQSESLDTTKSSQDASLSTASEQSLEQASNQDSKANSNQDSKADSNQECSSLDGDFIAGDGIDIDGGATSNELNVAQSLLNRIIANVEQQETQASLVSDDELSKQAEVASLQLSLDTSKSNLAPLQEPQWDEIEELTPEQIEHYSKLGLKEGDVCPVCMNGILMMRHSAKSDFLGCSNYPSCKFHLFTGKRSPVTTLKELTSLCPQCHGNLEVKKGRFGIFIGCSNYPSCNYVYHREEAAPVEEVTCPICQKGHLVERRGRSGKKFFGCSNYPECSFSVFGVPVKETCKECGFTVMYRHKLKKGTALVCGDPNCPSRKKRKRQMV